MVSREDIAENDYSLTSGRYVGVTLQADDDFDYQARLLEIQSELKALNADAITLTATIEKNLEELTN